MRIKDQEFPLYERPFDWDTYSAKEKLDDIVERLAYITKQERYKEMRVRWCTEEQQEREFGEDYDKHLLQIWMSCKADYLESKNLFDTFMELNPQAQFYKNCIIAMNQVIDDEIDNILLEGGRE